MEPTQRRQRGIYSEVLAPEETQGLQETAASGPSNRIILRPNQKLPRARGIGRRNGNDLQEPSESQQSSGIYSKKREGVADVDPKVFEPYIPIPGRTPRKVVIDRKKKFLKLCYSTIWYESVSSDHQRLTNK